MLGTTDEAVVVPGILYVNSTTTTATETDIKLFVNGQINANSFNAASDVRLKTNIIPVKNSLAVINSLRGVSFTWKTDVSNKPVLGLIAQELEKVIPEIVNTSSEDNTEGFKSKSVHYDGLFPHLIESIKTLTQDNQQLSGKVDSLTQENDMFKARLRECEDNIAKLLEKR
jgi:hypothetical protein